MNSIRENWELIKKTVKKEYDLTDISFNTWIMPLKLHNVEDDIVKIIIPSDQGHALNYISNKYKSYFQVTISEMMNHMYDVQFMLEKEADDEDNSNPEKQKVKDPIYNINYENANLNSKYKFDTFVVGSTN